MNTKNKSWIESIFFSLYLPLPDLLFYSATGYAETERLLRLFVEKSVVEKKIIVLTCMSNDPFDESVDVSILEQLKHPYREDYGLGTHPNYFVMRLDKLVKMGYLECNNTGNYTLTDFCLSYVVGRAVQAQCQSEPVIYKVL